MGQTSLSFFSSAHVKILSAVKAHANVWQTVTFFLDMRVGKRLSLPPVSPVLTRPLSFSPIISLSLFFSFFHSPFSLSLFSLSGSPQLFGRSDQNKNRNTRHRRDKYAMIHWTKGFALFNYVVSCICFFEVVIISWRIKPADMGRVGAFWGEMASRRVALLLLGFFLTTQPSPSLQGGRLTLWWFIWEILRYMKGT